jgi:hypothetical protein
VSSGLVVTAGARNKSYALESEIRFRCPGRVIRGAGSDTGLGTVEYNKFGVLMVKFWMTWILQVWCDETCHTSLSAGPMATWNPSSTRKHI